MHDCLPEPTVSIKLLTLKIGQGNRKYFGLCFLKVQGWNRELVILQRSLALDIASGLKISGLTQKMILMADFNFILGF